MIELPKEVWYWKSNNGYVPDTWAPQPPPPGDKTYVGYKYVPNTADKKPEWVTANERV